MCLLYIRAWIATKSEGKQIQAEKDSVREMEQETIKEHPVPVVGPFVDFPNYDSILAQYKENFRQAKKLPGSLVVFGDSIANQLRSVWGEWLVDPNFNYSYPGMWSNHITRMMQDMAEEFSKAMFQPKYVLIGTLGGNNLLQRQEVSATIGQVLEMLNTTRKLFPVSKIIIYDLPRTIVAYLIENRQAMQNAAINWMGNDGNSVFLKLDSGYVEGKQVFPKKDESRDGVHFTPLGILQFCADIKQGIKIKVPAIIS